MKKSHLLLLVLLLTLPFSAFAQSALAGDVNSDLEVDLADANAVIDIILSGDATTKAADVNGDGEINLADVNAVIRLIMSVEYTGDWVDLGLPSGTIWAMRNVGASSPEDYGDYFAWGETSPKDYYDWSTYEWCNGSYETLTKYCNYSYFGFDGFVDSKTELDPSDDVACAHYLSGRMPSRDQIAELCNNCSWTWTQQNGVYGQLVTGLNGNTMFLPAAGCRWGDTLICVGSSGYYWSRTLGSIGPSYAYYLGFDSGYWSFRYTIGRNYGFTVRAVRAQ